MTDDGAEDSTDAFLKGLFRDDIDPKEFDKWRISNQATTLTEEDLRRVMPDWAWQTCPDCGVVYRHWHECKPKKKVEEVKEKRGGK